MSYKYRRQSIYLQRKSLSRGNSAADPYDDWSDGTDNAAVLAAQAAAMAQIPPPNIETMKVTKGFEFVTFTPVEVKPPKDESCLRCDGDDFGQDSEMDEDNNEAKRSMSITSVTAPTDTVVKSFNLEKLPNNIVIDEITEGESRESLFAYVSNKFCYGTKAALQMSIRDMVNSYVFQYTLESFCEKRELCWTYEPYNGGCLYVDSLENNGSINGANCNMLALPENAWKVNVDEVKELELIAKSVQSTDDKTDNENEEPNGLFQNKAINVIVPGTVSVHSCHYCGGVGRKRCITCVGSGSKTCQYCNGHGNYEYYHKSALAKTLESSDYCWRCHGRGRLRCYGCNGDGMTTCFACLGSGQIKCYIKLIITLTNHSNTALIRDHNSAELPLDLLKLADGDVIFEEKGHYLTQIVNLIDDSIKAESERLLQLHQSKYIKNSRLILQRHRIKVIPIAKVFGYWQRKQFHYYVFGTQRRCYTTNYPQRFYCSCCCII